MFQLLGGGLGANEYTRLLRSAGRHPFWVVEIETLKRCALEWGTAPCPASGETDGGYCFHSYHTCPTAATKAAFVGSQYTWRFITAGVPLENLSTLRATWQPSTSSQMSLLPVVSSVSFTPAQIEIEGGFTRRGKASVTMHDLGVVKPDATQAIPMPALDLDKSVRNTGRNGYWWPRWLATWPHYRNMVVRLKRGFVSSSIATTDLATVWTGRLENITRDSKGDIKLECTDALEPLLKSLPREAGNINTLQADVSRSATSWTVEDVTRYTDPGPLANSYVYAEAETSTGRKEIVRISGRNETTQALTVVRGAFSTYAEPIRLGAQVVEVLAYGVGDTITEGRPLKIIKSLLELCGLDEATYINAASFDRAEALLGPVALRRVIRESTAANELINEICQLFQLAIFVGDSGLIEARVNFPASPGETINTVTDARNITNAGGSLKTGEKQRVTHCRVYYDHDDDGNGDFQAVSVYINGATYQAEYYGGEKADIQDKSLEGRWLRGDDDATAAWVASSWGVQFSQPPTRFGWTAELRDDEYELGALVDITSVDIMDAYGTQQATRAMIVEKRHNANSTISFVAQTYGHAPTSQGGKRIAIVAPAGQADYDSATDANKLHAYVGASATDTDGDGITDTTTVGASADDGWYL